MKYKNVILLTLIELIIILVIVELFILEEIFFSENIYKDLKLNPLDIVDVLLEHPNLVKVLSLIFILVLYLCLQDLIATSPHIMSTFNEEIPAVFLRP